MKVFFGASPKKTPPPLKLFQTNKKHFYKIGNNHLLPIRKKSLKNEQFVFGAKFCATQINVLIIHSRAEGVTVI